MQISKPKLIQALRNIGVQRYGVRIGHRVECAAGSNAHGNVVTGPSRGHRADDLKKKTNPVFNRTTVFVGSLVATILKKLIYEISVACMDLHTVETGFLRPLNGLGIKF